MPDNKITATEEQQVSTPLLNDGVPIAPDAQVPLTTDLSGQYISAGGNNWWMPLANSVRALPPSIDDVTAQFGPEVYEREMLTDPQVSAVSDIVRMGATKDGVMLAVPEHIGEDDPERPKAEQALALCEFALRRLKTPMQEVLYQLSSGMFTGHKIAENVWMLASVDGFSGKQAVIQDIRPKPNRAVRVWVDDKNNLVAYQPVRPGMFMAGQETISPDPTTGDITIPDALVPDKCINFVWDREDGGPMGRSMLRPVYTPWWIKKQVLADYGQYLATMAVPSVDTMLPENATNVTLTDGTELTPAEQMLIVAQNIQNGGTSVRPYGSTLTLVQSASSGDTFKLAFDILDTWIAKAITKQTLATEQASYDTLGGSQTHQDTLSLPTDHLADALCSTLKAQFCEPMVRRNMGDEFVHLTPDVVTAKVEQQDMASLLPAWAKVGYSLTPEQMGEVDKLLGLNERNMELYLAQAKANQEAALQIASAHANPTAEQPIDQKDGQEQGATSSAPASQQA